MPAINVDDCIKRYEQDIRKAAHWYYGLMPGARMAGTDALLQAGRIAVWKVAERHPEKIEIGPYVRAAIRYSIFGAIKEATPRIPQINVIRQDGEYVDVIDLLPNHDNPLEEKVDVDDLCHDISKSFSQNEADNLKILVANSRTSLLNLDLAHPPSAEVKDRVRLVTAMDLSDEDMLTYARVLVGERKNFPMGFISGHNERGRKYIKFALRQLGLEPEEFARLYGPREEMLDRFRLSGVVTTLYNGNTLRMVNDVFPQIPQYEIKYRGRWQGIDGLINAYDALEKLQKTTRKRPRELSREDFKRAGINNMLRALFDNSILLAIEFRWPGTFKGSLEEVKAEILWRKLEKSLRA